jgi:cell wall-associated NlpC family hydrolase
MRGIVFVLTLFIAIVVVAVNVTASETNGAAAQFVNRRYHHGLTSSDKVYWSKIFGDNEVQSDVPSRGFSSGGRVSSGSRASSPSRTTVSRPQTRPSSPIRSTSIPRPQSRPSTTVSRPSTRPSNIAKPVRSVPIPQPRPTNLGRPSQPVRSVPIPTQRPQPRPSVPVTRPTAPVRNVPIPQPRPANIAKPIRTAPVPQTRPAVMPRPATGTSSPSGAASFAIAQVGKTYSQPNRFGANSFDCSSLVKRAYESIGKKMPNTTRDYATSGIPVVTEPLKAGDVLWKNGHVGMYVGNGKVVSAENSRNGVQERSLDYYTRNFGYTKVYRP